MAFSLRQGRTGGNYKGGGQSSLLCLRAGKELSPVGQGSLSKKGRQSERKDKIQDASAAVESFLEAVLISDTHGPCASRARNSTLPGSTVHGQGGTE